MQNAYKFCCFSTCLEEVHTRWGGGECFVDIVLLHFRYVLTDPPYPLSFTRARPRSPNKKAKKPKSGASAAGLPLPLPGSIFHYHPEEEFLERSATHIHTYEFKTAQARTEESFGVEQRGRISIYEAPRLGEGIKAMQEGCT